MTTIDCLNSILHPLAIAFTFSGLCTVCRLRTLCQRLFALCRRLHALCRRLHADVLQRESRWRSLLGAARSRRLVLLLLLGRPRIRLLLLLLLLLVLFLAFLAGVGLAAAG